MTIEEYWKKQEQILQILSRATEIQSRLDSFSNSYCQLDKYLLSANRLYNSPSFQNSIRNAERIFRNYSDISEAVKQATNASVFVDTYNNLTKGFSTALDALNRYVENPVATESSLPILSDELIHRVSNVLSSVTPYMPDDIRDECMEVISASSPKEDMPTFLSFDRVVNLVILIATILSLILSRLPNQQLEEIIEQKNEEIAIVEEQLELERQKLEQLNDISNSLSEIIIDLGELIETQGE